MLAAAVPACLDTSDEPTEAPIATLAASATTTTSLGVTAWEVRPEADAFRLIGRSAAGERRVELVARTAGERIDVQAEYPEQARWSSLAMARSTAQPRHCSRSSERP